MTANTLVLYLNWSVFLVLFVRVLAEAIRRPWRVNIDVALLFGVPAASALFGLARTLGALPANIPVGRISLALLLLIATLLFRLVDDVVIVRAWARRGIGAAGLLVALLLVALPGAPWLGGVGVTMAFGLLSYGALAFLRTARLASGVTRRRLQVVALGSLLLLGTFAVAAPALLVPALRDVLVLLADTLGLAAGLCYFVGFTPPRVVRRAWQEPELRAFLGRATQLPRLPDTLAIAREFERGVARALGAPVAALGLWDAAAEALVFGGASPPLVCRVDGGGVLARAWHTRQASFAEQGLGADAGLAALAPGAQVAAALLAPVAVAERRIGVLVVLAERMPIFAGDDLALLQLLADQAAVIFENHALIEQAARVRAHSEATRLKEDFLAAVAHDLQTPLTIVLGRAELQLRRARRQPEAPADLASIQVLVGEGQRLKRLVLGLLDSAEDRAALRYELADLAALAGAVCARHTTATHPCRLRAPAPLQAECDSVQIEHLLDNLLENAIKYSPGGGAIEVAVERIGQQARISVSDQGIGIPAADVPQIFDRFHRAANASEQGFQGTGLGLFICREIAEQHGGSIGASSRPGQGTTFEVLLPLVQPRPAVAKPTTV